MTTATKTDAKDTAPPSTGLLTFRTVDAEYPKSGAISERSAILTADEFGPCSIVQPETGGYPNTRPVRIRVEMKDAPAFVVVGRNPDATCEPRLRIEPGEASAYECEVPRDFKIAAVLAA